MVARSSCRISAAPATAPLLVAVLVSTVLCGWVEAARVEAAAGGASEEPPSAHDGGPSDAAEVAAFLDGFFPPKMEEHRVPGAGVVVVRDGAVLAARGYGFADLDTKQPVVAERTLFPAASVSKLFTATAAMQLVEEGRLDLDGDVNRVLRGFRLPATFPEPVTLDHLLTHTAGFEDSEIGLLVARQEEVVPLGTYLAAHLAPRVRPPGRLHCYTNFATMLAGHLVEEASGRPFDRYVEERLLRPLAMERSAPWPVAGALGDDLAMGYAPAGEGYRSTRELMGGRTLRPAADSFPAGFLAAPVTDMAHFLIAHLEGGVYAGRRILAPETVRRMQATQFVQHPGLPGMALGFFEVWSRGARGLAHGGDGLGYGALLFLLPERRTGFYLAHSNASPALRADFAAAFVDRYLPAAEAQRAVPETAGRADARRLAGSFAQLRRNRTTVESLPTTLLQLRLTAPDAETLVLDWPISRRYRMTGPSTAERVDAEGGLAFVEDALGRPTYLYAWDGGLPQLMGFERMPWYASMETQLALLGGFAAAFLSAVVVFPAAALVRRLRRRGVRPARPLSAARWTSGAMAAGNLLFLLGFARLILGGGFAVAATRGMPLLLGLPLVTAGLALSALALAGHLWRRRLGSLAARLHLSAVALAGAAFPLYLAGWNLLASPF